MKLTREELIHARDYQLAAVGITRTGNQGWLFQALHREFTQEEVTAFKTVRIRAPKGSLPFCGKKRLRKAAAGTLDLFTDK